jgi:hypothetical protein
MVVNLTISYHIMRMNRFSPWMDLNWVGDVTPNNLLQAMSSF